MHASSPCPFFFFPRRSSCWFLAWSSSLCTCACFNVFACVLCSALAWHTGTGQSVGGCWLDSRYKHKTRLWVLVAWQSSIFQACPSFVSLFLAFLIRPLTKPSFFGSSCAADSDKMPRGQPQRVCVALLGERERERVCVCVCVYVCVCVCECVSVCV